MFQCDSMKNISKHYKDADCISVRSNKNGLQYCIFKTTDIGGFKILNEGTLPETKVLFFDITDNIKRYAYPRKKIYEFVRQAYLDGKYCKDETSIRIWARSIEQAIKSLAEQTNRASGVSTMGRCLQRCWLTSIAKQPELLPRLVG